MGKDRTEYNHQWYLAHRQRCLDKGRTEERKQYAKEYRVTHKKEMQERDKQYYQEHKLAACYYARLRGKELGFLRKTEVMMYYSNPQGSVVCNNCGEQDIDVLCIDHIKGGGSKHRKELGMQAGGRFYLYLQQQDYPEGYQVLCYNCNTKKSKYMY